MVFLTFSDRSVIDGVTSRLPKLIRFPVEVDFSLERREQSEVGGLSFGIESGYSEDMNVALCHVRQVKAGLADAPGCKNVFVPEVAPGKRFKSPRNRLRNDLRNLVMLCRTWRSIRRNLFD